MSPEEAPSLRFVILTSAALLVAYHLGALFAFGTLDDPRVALFLAGPVFLLVPLVAALGGADRPSRRAALRLGPVPLRANLLGTAAMIAWLPAILAVTAHLVPVSDSLEEFFADLLRIESGADLGIVVAGAAIAPAVSEEIFFRGFLQRGLEGHLGRWRGILLTAAVFGVVHGPSRAPAVTLFGVLLGWMASRSGSVWPSVTAHAAINVVAVAMINAAPNESLPETSHPPWAIVAAGAVAGGAFLFAFARSIGASVNLSDRSGPTPPPVAPP
jgi:membrane protease YdiL (CAAX protease family)